MTRATPGILCSLAILGSLGWANFSAAATVPVTSGLVYHLDALDMDANGTLDPLQGSSPFSDGDSIGTWNALTGGDATASTLNPTYVASGLNGNPVVRFSTGADRFTWTAVAGQTVIIYQRTQVGANGLAELVGVNGADTGIRRNGASAWRGTTTNSGDFTNPAGSEFYVDGVSTESDATSATDFSIVSAIRGTGSLNFDALGYYSSNNRFFVGDVAEVLIYDDILTTTERESVESYLTDKWASQAVPEPASFILIGLAGFCLMAVRRRRRRS